MRERRAQSSEGVGTVQVTDLRPQVEDSFGSDGPLQPLPVAGGRLFLPVRGSNGGPGGLWVLDSARLRQLAAFPAPLLYDTGVHAATDARPPGMCRWWSSCPAVRA